MRLSSSTTLVFNIFGVKEKRILKKCEAFGKVEEIVFPVALEPEVCKFFFYQAKVHALV